MRIQDMHEHQILGTAFLILGSALGAAAAVTGLMAVEHMTGVVEICGPTTGHCLRCVAAAALSISALGLFGAGARLVRSAPAPLRAG